jgi:hypothetical protein
MRSLNRLMGRWRAPPTPPPLPCNGARSESITFDLAPGEMAFPYVYGETPPWGKYGFAVPCDAIPDELQPYATVRKGRVQFRSRFPIPLECHDPKGLVFKLQVLEALNRSRNHLFQEVGCSVTAHAVFKEYNEYPPRHWSGWIMSPEKITIASW